MQDMEADEAWLRQADSEHRTVSMGIVAKEWPKLEEDFQAKSAKPKPKCDSSPPYFVQLSMTATVALLMATGEPISIGCIGMTLARYSPLVVNHISTSLQLPYGLVLSAGHTCSQLHLKSDKHIAPEPAPPSHAACVATTSDICSRLAQEQEQGPEACRGGWHGRHHGSLPAQEEDS